MELTDDEIIANYGKQFGFCLRNTLLQYEYELVCVSCGYNVIKRKHELTKSQRKKNFIKRLKFAENKIFCICTEIYKIYEVLSTLKNKKNKNERSLN